MKPIVTLVFVMLMSFQALVLANPWWNNLHTTGTMHPRHEASFVVVNEHGYLIGGRRLQPVDKLELSSSIWTSLTAPPIEMHHYQAISIEHDIFFIGGFTGGWPNEKPVDHVIVFDTISEEFMQRHPIPSERLRGAAAAVSFNDKIYIVGGITHGHVGGHVAWFDEYDPRTGQWQQLPDTPHARDHAVAVIADQELYVIGGRLSNTRPEEGFSDTIAEIDVFNFKERRWRTLPQKLPTPRAGLMAAAWENLIFIGGGESGLQVNAHSEVEIFDVKTQQWLRPTHMIDGRHGTHFAVVNNTIFVASGCLQRGGEPETNLVETLDLDQFRKIE